MFAQILGETTCGIDGVQILVEVDVSNGLPSFDLVGLPAMAVRESKERVKAALRNSNYPFPMTRITVNLAPADLRKEGSGLDLPIAVGLMTCGRILEPEKLESKVFIGELSLDGRIRKVSGVLSMIMDAKKCGAQEVYIPQANAAEGKLIHGIDVYTVATLKELVEHLKGKNMLTPLPKENILQNNNRIYHVDFADVKGQLVARRALEIAAAGGHSILMVGSPGCGKTMLARRLVTILPPMTEAEGWRLPRFTALWDFCHRPTASCWSVRSAVRITASVAAPCLAEAVHRARGRLLWHITAYSFWMSCRSLNVLRWRCCVSRWRMAR